MTHLRVAAANWPELERMLDAVLDLAPEARGAWLDSLGPEHEELRAALGSLLAHATSVQARDFLANLPAVTLSTSPASRAGELVGPWRLVREIGAGGMASVWLAERADGLLQRPVALKLPHNIAHWRGLAERMAREREILATLTHPHIARLYDAGVTADNIPWLAIEYIEGRSIDEYCREAPLAERLTLFLQVGEAVAYAHGKLIVHRDLKPANILVTAQGEARLLDFGIGALLEGDVAHESPLTEITGRALTLDYAAPEHIAGGDYTTSADVYSLGVILFELVTGRRPYLRGNEPRPAFESQLMKDEAPRASDVSAPEMRRNLRGDLDIILAKALKKNPAERYPTVAAFVEDVARHLDGRPVLAQPDSARYRAWKFVRRHKPGVAFAAALIIAILGGAALTAWQARVAIAERDRAEEVKRFIASIFQNTNPYQRSGGDLSAAELLRRARVQINDEFAARPDLRIELLGIVGASLNGLGAHPDAEATLREAADLATRTRGARSVETIRVRALLADVYNRQRDTAHLEAELKELLPLARAVSDQDPEPLLRVTLYAADLGIEVRRIDEARLRAAEAFQIARRAYGDRHRLSVQASNLLAETWTFAPYEFDTMLAQTARAFDYAKAAFGPPAHDPLLIYAQMLRARAFNINGRYDEARSAHAAVAQSLRAELGDNNLDVANAVAEQAGSDRNVGDLASALAHDQEALAIFEKLGNTHSLDFKNYLIGSGRTQLMARRPREALDRFRRARDISDQLLEPGSWETLGPRFHMAWALAYAGKHGEARELLALADRPGVKIAFPMWFARVKASVLRLGGDADGSIPEFERALSLVLENPRADWERMALFSEIGLAEFSRGNTEAAVQALGRALTLYEKYQVQMHPLYGEALVALGRIELQRGHPEVAEPLLARVDAWWQRFDPTHPDARVAHEWAEMARAGSAVVAR